MRHSGILRAEQCLKISTCFPNLLLTECLLICLFIYFEEHLLSFFKTRFLKYLPREILTDWIIIIKGEPLKFPPLSSNPTYLAEVSSVLSTTSVQFSSVAQSCLTLCNPMNCRTPGLPVHHQLPEFTQTHVHWVSDAIQPSHPLSSPSPPAPNPSQHQRLFQWVNSSHEVAKVLEFQL